MQLTITSVDYAPKGLDEQVPFVVDLIRELPGDDRPDYWLGALRKPIRWLIESQVRDVTHLVVAARWQGTSIAAGAEHLPIGIAYVIDSSVLGDARLDLAKCAYVAIGISTETGGGNAATPLKQILAGTIARSFGTENPSVSNSASRSAAEPRTKKPWFEVVAFNAALLLTLWALFLDTVTFATNDYEPILSRALACSATASALLVVCWKRFSMVGRSFCVVLGTANLWVFADAGARRLLGWW